MRKKLENAAKNELPQSDTPDIPIGPADQNTLQAIVRDFVQYCGGEDGADETINGLRETGGMKNYESD